MLGLTTDELIKIMEEQRISKEVRNNLSNRDYIQFDEKYVKLVFFCIAMNLKDYSVKSEIEVDREPPDLLMIPRDRTKDYKAVMIEFKYLKSDEKHKLQKMKDEAKNRIVKYSSYDDIKDIKGLHKYTIVAINDVLYIDEIE